MYDISVVIKKKKDINLHRVIWKELQNIIFLKKIQVQNSIYVNATNCVKGQKKKNDMYLLVCA